MIKERRCFVCGIFGHMACYCRNRREKGPAQVSLNKFEVLKDRVMQKGEGSGKEVVEDRREILKEERAKKRKTKEEKKEKLLREMMMKKKEKLEKKTEERKTEKMEKSKEVKRP